MIEGGKENEVQKKYRNGDECPDAVSYTHLTLPTNSLV